MSMFDSHILQEVGAFLARRHAVMQTIAQVSIQPCPFIEHLDAICVHAYLDKLFLFRCTSLLGAHHY